MYLRCRRWVTRCTAGDGEGREPAPVRRLRPQVWRSCCSLRLVSRSCGRACSPGTRLYELQGTAACRRPCRRSVIRLVMLLWRVERKPQNFTGRPVGTFDQRCEPGLVLLSTDTNLPTIPQSPERLGVRPTPPTSTVARSDIYACLTLYFSDIHLLSRKSPVHVCV